ncbi:MAG: ABC-F family ATP-binding cassette domain-containing protein [Saprospiraceae bacterium]|nr:ABC-F family ATP-binding cassette domain-containing protein [Saprospiraceae bacterium]
MIQLQDIRIQYGERVLFKQVSFQINPQDKIALIGRNGYGKSTLFSILSGELSPDDGQISQQKGIRLGLLPQTLTIDPEKTIREAAQEAFTEVVALEAEHHQLQKSLEEATDYESQEYLDLLEAFHLNLERLNHYEVGSMDKKIELVLKGLGFDVSVFDKPISTLSGGWQMRVELAKLLLQQPDLLLLDEPTNHLDIEAIIWLEEYINEYPNAVVVISHDRAFLRNTAKRVIEIENSKVYDYVMNYDRYLVQKEEVRTQQEAAFKNQQKEIAEKEKTIKRFMAKATKTSMAQSMQKQLDKIDRIELDAVDQKEMNIRFLPIPRSSRTVLKARNLHKSFGKKKVLSGLDVDLERGDRVAIVGQNGQGKTTLSKILLKKLEASEGQVEYGTQLAIGYYAQNQSDLLEDQATILEFMELRAPEGMRTRVRSLLGAFMFSGEDVEKKIKVLSGGERARLAFAHLLMQPINLLVLDEPTNHLDLASKEVLKEALLDYEGTLVVISHDRDFLADLTTKTLELRDHKMHTYLGDVNYFLEKRAMDDLRSVAMYKSDQDLKAQEQQKKNPELTQDEIKSLQKKVKSVEKKIFNFENEIRTLELKMADPEFYNLPDATMHSEQYHKLKRELSEAENEWEALVDSLENS